MRKIRGGGNYASKYGYSYKSVMLNDVLY